MSITDVMSQLNAMQQLANQLAAPPAQIPTQATFASILDAASASATPTSATSATSAAATPAASGATSTQGDSLTPASSSPLSQATLLSSILEQSQAQALLGTLGDDGSDDGSDDGLGDIGSLESLAALMPSAGATAATAGSTPATTTAATTGAASAVPTALGVSSPTGATDTGAQTSTPSLTSTPSAGGLRLLEAAESQIGVHEQPMGSNNGPQIAEYRSAVAGSEPGEPWCAYFASWAAGQAGEPLGPDGQGFGSVAEITSWASSTGRLLPANATPAPGDLILFGDQHVGIVESVNPDGSLTTVEGNYNNAVTQVHRPAGEATGFVAM